MAASYSLMAQVYLAPVEIDNKWGFIDTNGLMQIEPRFQAIIPSYQYRNQTKEYSSNGVGYFSEGLAAYVSSDKWGYIDLKGNPVIDNEYDYAGYFIDGLAMVSIRNEYGFINQSGIVVIPIKFNDATRFSEGLAGVVLKRKWGFIDQKGNMVIDYQFSEVGLYVDGLCPVKHGGSWGVINKAGEWVIPPRFGMIENLTDGYFRFKIKGGGWGLMSSKGEPVIRPVYGHLSVKEEVVRARLTGDWLYLDLKGKPMFNVEFANAEDFCDGIARARRDDYVWWYVKKDGQILNTVALHRAYDHSCGRIRVILGNEPNYSFLDSNGDRAFESDFVRAEDFYHNRAMVRQMGDWSFIDLNGNLIADYIYENAKRFRRAD